MAFNLADMVNKRPKQVQQENTAIPYTETYSNLSRRKKISTGQTRTGSGA